LFLLSIVLSATASAQLEPPNQSGVAMGHLHLVVRDLEAQKRFWVEAMRAVPVKLGTMDAMKLPGVLVFLAEGEPQGDTEGVVAHIGFKVRNLQASLIRMRAVGANILSEKDQSNLRAAFLMAPDQVKIELTEDRSFRVDVGDHRIHFSTLDVKGMQAWYVGLFDARSTRHGRLAAADLPGVRLVFSEAGGKTAGSKGRSIDHIGFEVANLEGFCRKLEARGIKFEVSYQKRPDLGIALAFLTDPWGTVIELTEGLNRL
jgi:catechol 2,3-dioxygenase-like lactoylglutathione lyase family enzyme